MKIAGVDGGEKNAYIVGYLKTKRPCQKNRNIKLFADGKLADSGTTTKRGAWALHIGLNESTATTFKISLASSKLPNGDKCGSDSLSLSPSG